jgi:hypothetical protein
MPNWNQVLNEIQQLQIQGQASQDILRRKYLTQLHEKTGRNVIAYYSGWLSKPGLAQLTINDEDKNGFMSAVHQLDRSRGLDLILHTPGGSIAATQSIVDYLHKMFGSDIRAIIPQIAMSAGTMIACSCKQIVMGAQSNLGPIDPHFRDVPTYGIIKEFKRALREIKGDPSKIAIWQPIISQYRPTFLSQCEQAIKLSSEFVQEQLTRFMFADDPKAKQKAKRSCKALSDYTRNKSHDRHIHAEECEKIGLKILRLEEDNQLQDLVLTVHHCYMHSLAMTAFKIIENHLGVASVKHNMEQPSRNVPPSAALPL